jgi:hypothetical protein
LAEISEAVGGLVFHEVATGTQVGDWVVPNEWNLRRARLIGPDGTTICDTSENNLHVLNYSLPFSGKIDLEELQSHIYSLPEQPDAIPYVTSYYEPRWGFSMSHNVRQSLQDGEQIRATPGDKSVVLQWEGRTTNYFVFVSTDNFQTQNHFSCFGNMRTIQNLTNGKMYWFKIRQYETENQPTGLIYPVVSATPIASA